MNQCWQRLPQAYRICISPTPWSGSRSRCPKSSLLRGRSCYKQSRFLTNQHTLYPNLGLPVLKFSHAQAPTVSSHRFISAAGPYTTLLTYRTYIILQRHPGHDLPIDTRRYQRCSPADDLSFESRYSFCGYDGCKAL